MRRFVTALFLIMVFSSQLAVADTAFVTQEFSPFTYESSRHMVSGPATIIVRKICATMGENCSFVILPWRRAQNYVETGKAQGMFVIGRNKKREKWLHFSPPILQTQYGFFARKDSGIQYRSLHDLAGKNVGVYGPSNTATSLYKIRDEMFKQRIKPINIIVQHDDTFSFRMLSKGNRGVELVFSNRDVGHSIIEQASLKNVHYVGKHKNLLYYIGFSKKYTSRTFMYRFNKTFEKLYENGFIPNVLKTYSLDPVVLKNKG